MSKSPIAQRYEEFQKEAVACIESDFKKEPGGRFLLVIPTGGGKTYTAVKSVCRLFSSGVLDPSKDSVLWIAHREELIKQAKDTLRDYLALVPNESRFQSLFQFSMLSGAKEIYAKEDSIRLVVIDEAHHSAASSYLPLFRKKEVGVLGLTATPSRHDGEPLEFERESFSIGIPELIERGIILRPEIIKVHGERSEVSSLDDPGQLEGFNTKSRNKKIADAIAANHAKCRKIVVYVGTNNHVQSLFDELQNNQTLRQSYESIAFITGSKNSRNEERDAFLKKEKKWRSSILINCQVLTEGYDDPTIDTVLMATPTKSKLVYMQCMGRAIRLDKNNELKKSYIIEVEDDLPNIRYRIDNRWMYAEISDALEPKVDDYVFATETEFKQKSQELFQQYNVPTGLQPKLDFDPSERYGFLFLKVYETPTTHWHLPLVLTKTTRRPISNLFNYISERAEKFRTSQTHPAPIMKGIGVSQIPELASPQAQGNVWSALLNSLDEDPDKSIRRPWVTYVTLRHKPSKIPKELEEFCADLLNKEQIISSIQNRSYQIGGCIVRLPLPLSGYIGKILTPQESTSFTEFVDNLFKVRDASSQKDHRAQLQTHLQETIFPLEQGFLSSAVTIVRENKEYKFNLKD